MARHRLGVELDLASVPVLEDGYAPVDALLNLSDESAAPLGAAAGE